jgi:acetate---CoA ligase (ADP-forming)
MNGGVNSLDRIFKPRSVAVIGASEDATRISGRPISYLLKGGFKGPIYPINPNRDTVQGLRCYGSIRDLPEVPDVAVLAVAANRTLEAVSDCAGLGVPGAILFAAGFAETGEAGRRAQDEILTAARSADMRLLGPNCLGAFCASQGFFGTFGTSLERGFPTPGPVAVVSQSGAYGQHLTYMAGARGMGVNYCITTGNELDIDVAEALLWLVRQPDVRVIMAYGEGARDGGRLITAFEEALARGKSVIFMKVGSSPVGARAITSHTAALAGSDQVYTDIFRQFGVIRARSTEEQLDIAYACARGIFPQGNSLGIVTVSGGAGVQAADFAHAEGLDVVPLSETGRTRLQEVLSFVSVSNPLDLTGQTVNDEKLLERGLEVLRDENFDAVLAYFSTIPLMRAAAVSLRQLLSDAACGTPDRLMVLSMTADIDVVREFEAAGFLVFEDNRRAIVAISALVRLAESFRASAAAPKIRKASNGSEVNLGKIPLSEASAKRLLSQGGLPILDELLANDAEDAVAAASRLGFPVAMKIVSPDILHKTEIGGVILNVADAEAVRQNFATLLERAKKVPGAQIEGVLVSPMAPRGVETILGTLIDPTFGPLVMFGLGGVLVEVFRDVSFRLAPFDDAEALRMINDTKAAVILAGTRGAGPSDLTALARALSNLSHFAAANARVIDTVDVNPFLVLPEGQGAVALDAVIVPHG